MRASMSRATGVPETDIVVEESPLLLSLRRALQALLRKASTSFNLTETAEEVDAFCGALEALLLHHFKSRQFYMFTCHPWSLVEQSESWGELEAESVALARNVGSSDPARLRAWIFVQLNQRSLQQSLGALLNDEGLRSTFFNDRALLLRQDCRQLLVDLLRPLRGLNFRLGAAAGLASVAVVADLVEPRQHDSSAANGSAMQPSDTNESCERHSRSEVSSRAVKQMSTDDSSRMTRPGDVPIDVPAIHQPCRTAVEHAEVSASGHSDASAIEDASSIDASSVVTEKRVVAEEAPTAQSPAAPLSAPASAAENTLGVPPSAAENTLRVLAAAEEPKMVTSESEQPSLEAPVGNRWVAAVTVSTTAEMAVEHTEETVAVRSVATPNATGPAAASTALPAATLPIPRHRTGGIEESGAPAPGAPAPDSCASHSGRSADGGVACGVGGAGAASAASRTAGLIASPSSPANPMCSTDALDSRDAGVASGLHSSAAHKDGWQAAVTAQMAEGCLDCTRTKRSVATIQAPKPLSVAAYPTARCAAESTAGASSPSATSPTSKDPMAASPLRTSTPPPSRPAALPASPLLAYALPAAPSLSTASSTFVACQAATVAASSNLATGITAASSSRPFGEKEDVSRISSGDRAKLPLDSLGGIGARDPCLPVSGQEARCLGPEGVSPKVLTWAEGIERAVAEAEKSAVSGAPLTGVDSERSGQGAIAPSSAHDGVGDRKRACVCGSASSSVSTSSGQCNVIDGAALASSRSVHASCSCAEATARAAPKAPAMAAAAEPPPSSYPTLGRLMCNADADGGASGSQDGTAVAHGGSCADSSAASESFCSCDSSDDACSFSDSEREECGEGVAPQPPDKEASGNASALHVSNSTTPSSAEVATSAPASSSLSGDGIGISSQQPPLLSAVVFDYFSPGSVATRQESSRASVCLMRTTATTPRQLAVRTVQVLGSEERETLVKPFRRSVSSSEGSLDSDLLRGTLPSESCGNGSVNGSVKYDGRRAGKRFHTTYRVRALVGPFECTSSHRFSEFLKLHSQLQRSCGKDKARKQHLAQAMPTGKKLRESKHIIFIPNRSRVVEARMLLIARYCEELCAASSLAQSEIVTGFFWPCDGAGSVVAPDGSMASLMGDAEHGGISFREETAPQDTESTT